MAPREKARAEKAKGPKPSKAFKDYGWILIRNDNHSILKISSYSWGEGKSWCSKVWTKGSIVQKIVAPAYSGEADSCEIFIVPSATSAITSFVLKTSNIIGSLDYLATLKTIGLPKAQKWWANLTERERNLRTSMLEVCKTLNDLENSELVNFMDAYGRYASVGSSSLNVQDVQMPEHPSSEKKWVGALSFPENRCEGEGSQFDLHVPSQVSGHTSHLPCGGLRDGDSRFELTADDVVASTQEPSQATTSKSKRKRLVTSQMNIDKSSGKELLDPPSQDEIDKGYILGRDFSYMVDIDHVRAPTDGFTNQRILNMKNAKKVYNALRSRQLVENHWITLRPMYYKDPNSNAEAETYFTGKDSKDVFLQCLEAISGSSIEEKRHKFLNGITFEPVDGQHVVYACSVLAKQDLLDGSLSQDDYDKIFARRPATLVLYDDNITYLFSSTRLNDITTNRKYHSTTGEMLEKARIIWDSLGRPSAEDDKRKNFLRCMPGITSQRLGEGETSHKDMRIRFRDYTSMVTLPDACWQALKVMCYAYDNGLTFKSKKQRVAELSLSTIQSGKKPKKSISERLNMSIDWLRPLQGLTINEHILLCKMATTDSLNKEQDIWFVGGEDKKSLQHWCEVAKLRAGIQNAFKWLEAGRNNPLGENKNWLQVDVGKFGSKDALDYFARDILKGPDFQKQWSHINPQTAFGKQRKHVELIPRNLIDHHLLVSNGGLGLFSNGKVIPRNEDGDWKMIFDYEGGGGLGFSIQVKTADSIFNSNGGSLGRNALWVFDCRYGPKGGYWTESEYTSVLDKIKAWMGDVQRWNCIFMLPVGENADHIKRLMVVDNIPEYYVQVGTYNFGSQSKSTGIVVKDGLKTIAKFSPSGQYILLLRHPAKSFLEDNFAKDIQTIYSYYIEPSNGWSMCSRYRNARCPAVVEALINHFYRSDWVMVMEGFSHMIENVSGRVEQLILMEPNVDIHGWLEKWKECYVDKVREPLPIKDPLWLDKEFDKDDSSEFEEREDEGNVLRGKRKASGSNDVGHSKKTQ